jgi:hypothetical protein
MTIAEQILSSVARLIQEDKLVFTRNEIRLILGLDRLTWDKSYSPIFQGMRID